MLIYFFSQITDLDLPAMVSVCLIVFCFLKINSFCFVDVLICPVVSYLEYLLLFGTIVLLK
jgi:hypothetical protein